jgi:hypothetical protein
MKPHVFVSLGIIIGMTILASGCVTNEVHTTITIKEKIDTRSAPGYRYYIVTSEDEPLIVFASDIFNQLERGETYSVAIGGYGFYSEIGIIEIIDKKRNFE